MLRSISVLLACVFVASNCYSGPWPRPDPPATLGEVIQTSHSIHLLTVRTVEKNKITFKISKTYKTDHYFHLEEAIAGWKGASAAFRVGDRVLSILRGGRIWLFVRDGWINGRAPLPQFSEDDWEWGGPWKYSEMFEGDFDTLCDHVSAILAGKEVIITARAPQFAMVEFPERLWRIKAGLKITKRVDSVDSPNFVGWGTGKPDELLLLAGIVRHGEFVDRIRAVKDLACLGSNAKPAAPLLRSILKEKNPEMVATAALALTLIDPEDNRSFQTLASMISSTNADDKTWGMFTTGKLGIQGRRYLPALIRNTTDKRPDVRYCAAKAIGKLAPGSGMETEAVRALAKMLKMKAVESYDQTEAVVDALHRLTPHSSAVASEIANSIRIRDMYFSRLVIQQAFDLLLNMNPPPVEFMAERYLKMSRIASSTEYYPVRFLVNRGTIAYYIIKSQTVEGKTRFAPINAAILIEIDPARAVELAPLILAQIHLAELNDKLQFVELLGKCGAPGKKALISLLSDKEENHAIMQQVVAALVPLLQPEDRQLLPKLLPFLKTKKANPFGIVRLYELLGLHNDARAMALRLAVQRDSDYQLEALDWLNNRGIKSAEVVRIVKQQMLTADEDYQILLKLVLFDPPVAENWKVKRSLLSIVMELSDDWFSILQEEEYLLASRIVFNRILNEKQVIATLIRMVDDRDPGVRLIAIQILAVLQPDHPRLVPCIRYWITNHYAHPYAWKRTFQSLGTRAKSLVPVFQAQTLKRQASWPNEIFKHIDPDRAANFNTAASVPGAVPKDLTPLWKDLAGADAFRADFAVWRMAGAGARAVAFLKDNLRPPAALPVKTLAKTIADLDSDSFAVREKASGELAKYAESAASSLRKTLGGKASLEMRTRITALLRKLDSLQNPEQRRRLRAVRLLIEMHRPEAKSLLATLARDSRYAYALDVMGVRP